MAYIYGGLSLSIFILAAAFYLEIKGAELDNPRPEGDDGGR